MGIAHRAAAKVRRARGSTPSIIVAILSGKEARPVRHRMAWPWLRACSPRGKGDLPVSAPRWNAVHCQDCIAGMKRLDDGVVDLAFADPPFNIGYDYDVYHDTLEVDHYLDWSRQWTAQVVRVLKPQGTFWLAIGDEYAAELKVMLQKEHGLVCRSWVVWYYTFGVNCKYKFSRSHAHLFYMVKDPAAFTFHAEAVNVPSARQLVYADRRANPAGRLPDDTWILRPQDLADGFRPDQDTWYFPRVCGTFKERAGWHGCQMPEQLLGRIIRATSSENELVLDPFAGSGTTLAVAKKLGRRFLGFELSHEYVARIKERLAAIRAGEPLEGAPEPLASVPSTAAGRRLDAVQAAVPSAGRRRRKPRPDAAAHGASCRWMEIREGRGTGGQRARPHVPHLSDWSFDIHRGGAKHENVQSVAELPVGCRLPGSGRPVALDLARHGTHLRRENR